MATQTAAAGASGGGGNAPAASAGQNPFWEVTNLFSQKNKEGQVTSYQLTTSTLDGGGNINPGNILRGLRLLVRSNGGVGGSATADNPANVFSRLGVQNTDGAEILYSVIYDYAAGINPSFTMFLQPEVRQQMGALENTDTRSQYRWTQTINTAANVVSGGSTAPTVTVTPYVDMWAQPDERDLEGVGNQRIPAGVNLQTKTRHQTFTLNSAGSDNNFLSTLTGNAVRFMLLIVRDGNNARQDYLTEPISWSLDSRNLGTLAPDIVFQWANDFYAPYSGRARPTGVYPFPRFYSPGELYGQGWLYTANSTALNWETATLS